MSAFSRTELCTAWKTAFDDATTTLTVRARQAAVAGRPKELPLLLQANLCEPQGKADAEAFFSEACEEPVTLLDGEAHHQFGNTNSGLKASGDLRTLHIVNVNSVAALSDAAGVSIDARRLRPNLILSGSLPPFAEFGWVGGTIRIGDTVTLRIVKRTIRCPAVTLWGPGTAAGETCSSDKGDHIDVPALLQKHFPEHGPYLGVYAQVETPGTIVAGDEVVQLQPARAVATRRPFAMCGCSSLPKLALVVLVSIFSAYGLLVLFPGL